MQERSSGSYRHKKEIPVLVRLAGDAPFDATIFVVNGERLTDLLNDPRAFIPIRKEDGTVMAAAKSKIISIEETLPEQPKPESVRPAGKGFDPYEMLNVKPGASVDEIRAAYKARIKTVHPDIIASMGLDEELAKAALLMSQKVNYAYRKIMKEREAVSA